ncbi:MAG: insulinase family protein [Clostridia bacterium]|nr:insulinase family protein [Clostridia bacterium]
MNHYTLSQSRFIRDLQCEAKIYTHDKTGARIVVMPAADDNKAISIAFATPAENDKGIPHIIEHSVLCGSEKYPLKDPFLQLMKGSMYSFLNAMTYSDFTVYPVASVNEKDFRNLMDVYLDAVFNPLLPGKKEVFLQEGRHFALNEDETAVKEFNGVVFNEMKGVEGSAEALLEEAITASLYKGTPYAYESGGLPLAICDLSFEELTDFYRRHYNASNSFIFLYGNIDEEETLGYISDNYLDRYDRSEVIRVGETPEDGFDSEVSAPYPADKSKLEKGYYFSYNFALHIPHTPLNLLTLRALDRILCTSQSAYIRNAMQKAGVGEDFDSMVEEMIKVPMFSLFSAGCRESDREAFTRVIETTLEGLVQNGIDKERLNATLNILEFREKEDTDTWKTKGISYAIQMLPKLLYDEEDPLELLEFFDAIDRLKELAATDYFERFIERHFLRNPHRNFVTLYPDTEFTAREDRLIAEKCRENAAKEDFAGLVSDYRRLNEYRDSEDTPEDAARIPLLERSDLSSDPDYQPSRRIAIQGGELIYQERQTNSIAYLDWSFDIRRIDSSLLPYYRIFTELFGAVDTKSHGYEEISDLIDSYTGGISHVLSIIDPVLEGEVIPFMSWRTKFLYHNAAKAFELNREMLLETDFSDTDHIRDMLLQLKTGMERDLLESSNIFAAGIGLSAYSESYAWKERLQGHSFYKFLCGLLSEYDARKDELVASLDAIRESLLDRDGWTYAYVGEESFLPQAVSMTEDFIKLLSEKNSSVLCEIPLSEKHSAGLYSPSQVQYAALCGRLPAEAFEKRGYLMVLRHLLDTDYLWQNIRVLGGAYGCGVGFERSGAAVMVSYRDPNLDETYACYRNAVEYIQSLEMDERTFRQFVIGALNSLDRPRPTYIKGFAQIQREMCGVTLEEAERVRKQIISATPEDIKGLIPLLESWLAGATETVIGGEQKIRASEIRFDSVKPLI